MLMIELINGIFFGKGIRRDAIMFNGKYADDILMAMLEDEWKQMAMPCLQPCG